jgi:UDP-2,3-diacylglucosamine pyrophosphatase LpxH
MRANNISDVMTVGKVIVSDASEVLPYQTRNNKYASARVGTPINHIHYTTAKQRQKVMRPGESCIICDHKHKERISEQPRQQATTRANDMLQGNAIPNEKCAAVLSVNTQVKVGWNLVSKHATS